MTAVVTVTADSVEIPDGAVFGFLGTPKGDAGAALEQEVRSVKAELLPCLTPRACYAVFRCSGGNLGFAVTESRDAERRLRGCERLILLAATVGVGADRLVAKYSRLSPSRGLIMQAAGAAAVECWLDRLCRDLQCRFGDTAPRFSCGYGDLPLELQRDIFRVLMPEKHIGVSLTDSLFMTPTKSVTAIVGIRESR